MRIEPQICDMPVGIANIKLPMQAISTNIQDRYKVKFKNNLGQKNILEFRLTSNPGIPEYRYLAIFLKIF